MRQYTGNGPAVKSFLMKYRTGLGSAAAAACLLFFFMFVFIQQSNHISLGSTASLYVSNNKAPDIFLTPGETVSPGDSLKVAFFYSPDKKTYRQAVIFAYDSLSQKKILFNGSLEKYAGINQSTILENRLEITPGYDWTFFVMYLSGEQFDTGKVIEKLIEEIDPEHPGMQKKLKKKYKNGEIHLITLRSSP